MKEEEKISKAVALKYESGIDFAPKVIAKGRGIIADIIKKIAIENDIPIYEDKELVDILEKIEIDYEIPEILYEVVAEILAFAYKINKMRKKL